MAQHEQMNIHKRIPIQWNETRRLRVSIAPIALIAQAKGRYAVAPGRTTNEAHRGPDKCPITLFTTCLTWRQAGRPALRFGHDTWQRH